MMKKLILTTLVSLLITSCLPRDMQLPQSPLLSTLERKSGLIAYIGVDGNIFVSDQAGDWKEPGIVSKPSSMTSVSTLRKAIC